MSQKLTQEEEDKRAYRIAFRLNASHQSLAVIYENLVDRDFSVAEKEIKQIVAEMRLILKSIQQDDF
jgi:hypothetical protein